MVAKYPVLNQSSPDITATWAGNKHLFLLASVRCACKAELSIAEVYAQIANVLKEHNLQIVHERIFGCLSRKSLLLAARQQILQTKGVFDSGPLTFIEGRSPWGSAFSGVIIEAVSAEQVSILSENGTPYGWYWKDERGADFLVLQNIRAETTNNSINLPYSESASLVIDRAQRLLKQTGLSYRNVVRTWFYLSDILYWYTAFNKVRDEKYRYFGLMPAAGMPMHYLPSSTAVSGKTSPDSICSMDLIAAAGDSSFEIKALSNALQLDAYLYGSAFSRASLIELRDASILQISGTAAIDDKGNSLFPNDARAQIDCTLNKLEFLMSQVGAGLRDIAAATAFVKRAEYGELFFKLAAERGLDNFPAVCVQADICRDELLFEIDAEAVIC